MFEEAPFLTNYLIVYEHDSIVVQWVKTIIRIFATPLLTSLKVDKNPALVLFHETQAKKKDQRDTSHITSILFFSASRPPPLPRPPHLFQHFFR